MSSPDLATREVPFAILPADFPMRTGAPITGTKLNAVVPIAIGSPDAIGSYNCALTSFPIAGPQMRGSHAEVGCLFSVSAALAALPFSIFRCLLSASALCCSGLGLYATGLIFGVSAFGVSAFGSTGLGGGGYSVFFFFFFASFTAWPIAPPNPA